LSFADYVGNGLADVAASIATKRAQPQGEVLRMVEQQAHLAFCICMRLAVIEAAIRDHTTTCCIVVLARPLVVAVSPAALLLRHRQAIADKGHILAILPSGKVTCTSCNLTKPISDLRFWSEKVCAEHSYAVAVPNCSQSSGVTAGSGVQPVPSAVVIHAVEPERFRGTMQQIKALGRLRSKTNVFTRSVNRASAASASCKLVCGIAVLGTVAEPYSVESIVPAWAALLHASHQLWHAGGVVWCARCGAVLSSIRKSRLMLVCGASSFHSGDLLLAKGSQTRLQQLMLGRCVVGPGWPDGRPKAAVLVVRRVM
jgi:hypothetical protein